MGMRPDANQITAPVQIARILQRVCDQHTLVTISLPGSDQRYTSSILLIDPGQSLLRMDELVPRKGHELLSQGRSFKVSTRLDGVDVGFAGTVREVTWDGNVAVYTVPLPDVLRYDQRRAFFRIGVAGAPGISVYMEGSDGKQSPGTLDDISLGGMCATLKGAATDDLVVGDRIPACAIDLPDGTRVRCALDVRYVRAHPRTGAVRVGVQFVDLPRTDQQVIARFIASVERDRLRHRPESGSG